MLVPQQLLADWSREYPQAWRQIAKFREDRGSALPWWPQWCYCPIAGAYAVITHAAGITGPMPPQMMIDSPPAVMAALAAWRITKGVYRFDPDLFREVVDMPLEGDLPAEVFYNLPEWCLYIEFPDERIAGFFAHLEYDANDGRSELRILRVKPDGRCIPMPIHLGKWTLREAVERAVREGKRFLPSFVRPDAEAMTRDYLPYVNLLLYICSVNADFGETGRPQHPAKKPTVKGKLLAAQEVRTWDIGVRMGAALRRAKSQQPDTPIDAEGAGEGNPSAGHRSPRPHYRRAHWHSFWTGPRGKPEEREIILKWLPPIPVGIAELDDETETPVIIHPVKE